MNWTHPYYQDSKEEIPFQEMYRKLSWVEDMAATPQDPIFHAEGDVWTHTRMVVESLWEDPEWIGLSPFDKQALFVSALMHDVAKPWTTETIDGRIRAPRHAKKGAKFSRAYLYTSDDGPDFNLRETIVQLIRFHGLPLWFWDKDDPRKFVLKASLQVDLKLLSRLVKADILGRICDDQDELLGRLDYFKEFSQEQNCYSNPFPFEDNLTRFTYFRKDDSEPAYVPYDDYRSEVILMSGLPGSGKNTWIDHQGPDWPVISLDQLRQENKISPKDNQGQVVNLAKEKARELLRKNQSFIWNATNLTKITRRGLIDLFETYKAKTKIVYLETPFHELLDRNKSRAHPVPTNVIRQMIRKLEIPEMDEAPEIQVYET